MSRAMRVHLRKFVPFSKGDASASECSAAEGRETVEKPWINKKNQRRKARALLLKHACAAAL